MVSSETVFKAILPFAGGAVGAVSGAYFKAWFDARRDQDRLRLAQRQQRSLPLLEAAIKLRMRLVELSGIYLKTMPTMPFTADSVSADFRELYALDREDRDLESMDPSRLRADAKSVQQVRVRMAHYLTYAASSLYQLATYLGRSEKMLRALGDQTQSMSGASRQTLTERLIAVQQALQGPTGAGIPWEEQQSVAEMMWGDNGTMISYFEFRKRLLELPGWEQYMGLHRFFVTIAPKIEHEVAATIKALTQLETMLKSVE